MGGTLSHSSNKPSIFQVVSQYVPLRKAGKEYLGLCPFHTEKHPSFYVNENKHGGVFFCHGCGAKGDVITFMQMIEGVDFKRAVQLLGIENREKLTRRNSSSRNRAERIAEWAHKISKHLCNKLRRVGARAYLCREALRYPETDHSFLADELNRLQREWVILSDLDDDLNNPETVVEMWKEHKIVEQLIGKL